MLFRHQAKKYGRLLARHLRENLVVRRSGGVIIAPPDWTISGSVEMGVSRLDWGDYTITLTPNVRFPAIRIFDQVRVAYKGCDVWLPLLPRLRTKSAARLHIALRALSEM